jgi:uncharacterized membrane protein YccC
MLLVSTPVGVGWGLVEAARFHAWLAALMALLIAVVGAFFWMTVSRIRRERRAADANCADASAAPRVAPPARRS